MKTITEYLQTRHIQTHYEAIDLGLSVKWANCNVGAEKPEDYGLLFQWGRTDGYAYDSKLGTSFEAKDGLIKTKDVPLATSGKTYGKGDVLDLKDDAAHVNMKGNWRMPTKDELQELIDNTTHKLTKLNGIKGYKFISKNDKTKSIFIPIAGLFNGYSGVFNDIAYCGSIWSSYVNSADANYAYAINFHFDHCDISSYRRYLGLSVRGVCK